MSRARVEVLSASQTAKTAKTAEPTDDPGTELVLLGTGGGPRPSLHRRPSAQVVRHGDRTILVDCGNGVAHQCLAAGLDPRDIDTVLVTHHHLDHNADLAVLPMTSWVNGRTEPITVAGPPPTRQSLRALLRGHDEDLRHRTASTGRPDFRELVRAHDLTGSGTVEDGGGIAGDGGVTITFTEVRHPPFEHALAYRVDTASGSVVVSGDTTPSASLVALARGADVLVHEVVHPSAIDRYERGSNAATIGRHLRENHTMVDEVAGIAAEADVGTLVLSHLVPHDLDDEAWLGGLGSEFAGPVHVGHDLMRVRLESGAPGVARRAG